MGKALRLAERGHICCALPPCGNVAAEPVDPCLEEERVRQGERVLPTREGHRLAGAHTRGVGLAEKPQVPRGIADRPEAETDGPPAFVPVVLRQVQSEHQLAVRE